MPFFLRQTRLFKILFILCAGIFSCKQEVKSSKDKNQKAPPIVDILIVMPQPMNNTIEANGTVVANEYLELHPEVSGRLTYLNVAEGKAVSQGTILARINDADLRAQMNKSKVQLQLAETTVGRYKQLLDAGGINQSDYDIAVNQVNGFRADMQYTQSLIDKTVIRAPFSGILGLRQVSPGAYVTAATVIATLQQISEVKIDFTIPEAYSNAIRIGSVVDISFGGGAQQMEKAIIMATEPGANTDTRNIKVRAKLQSSNVNPGAFAKVIINEGKERNAILVPTNAIIPDDKNNQVIVVKDGIANFVNVKTGNRLVDNVEIVSGLNPGDSVVITGVLYVRPKAMVKVRNVKRATG